MARSEIVSPYGRPNDAFGYAVYSIVVMASLEQQAAVDAVRKSFGNQRSMIPAHVTVKGTFCEIPSLDEVIASIWRVAEATKPFRVVFADEQPAPRTSRDGQFFATQPIRKTPDLVDLHDRLYDAIAPISTNAYAPEQGDNYWPHMTIFAEPLPRLAGAAPGLLDELDIGSGYDCDAMFLMGHIGPPYRGRWTALREFPFGIHHDTMA